MDLSFIDDEINESLFNLSIEPSSCNCNSTCSRARGKGQCPCRAIGQECTERCTCGTKKKGCCNKPSDSEPSTAEESEEERPRKQKRKRRRASQTPSQVDIEARLLDEQIVGEEEMIQTKVESLTREELNKLTVAMIKRTPGLYEDFLEQFLRPPPSFPEPSQEQVPKWCKCGRCREMARQVERKCCRQSRAECHSVSPRFVRLCLDPQVLDIVRFNLEDQYARAGDRGNRSYRHASYRTYVHWQHGRLGRGNRRVVPSCCTWAIRNSYPSPNGHYVGYQEGPGYRDD